MINESPQHLQLLLTDELSAGRMTVDLEPFLEFDIDMNHRLQMLEDRWADAVTPRSRRIAHGDEALRR